jgi:chitin synthase
VIKSESVLEAFGNARTADNNNSSRFGRYVEYQYSENGKLVGSKLLDYMLEKSRVCNMPDDGRNFNVFYQLLAGATAEERQSLRLTDPAHFHYLNNKYSKVSVEDNLACADLRENLKSLGVGRRQQTGIFKTLAAILHLGNIQFHDDPNKSNEACDVKNPDVLALASDLLGVLPVNLEYALTYKTKLIGKELCTIILNSQDAEKQRDALASTLYSVLFTWVVEHLNTRLDTEENSTFVGVLDFAGFQDYKSNRFEQLLYNFANEKLMHFVNQRIFTEKQAEYRAESLLSMESRFRDNSYSLRLLKTDGESENASILSILDRETVHPNVKKPDQHFVDSLNEKLVGNSLYLPSKKSGALSFTVKHYAGPVEYDAKCFLEKNSDAVSSDFITIFRGNGNDIPPTTNIFIATLFAGKGLELDFHPRNHAVVASAQVAKAPLRHPSLKRKKEASNGPTSSMTVAEAFDNSLRELFDTLSETVPWVVYCIKPNEDLVCIE